MEQEIQGYELTPHEYTTYPRCFLSYRWYKPLLTGLLFVVLYFFAASVLISVVVIASGDPESYLLELTGGYDTMNVSSVLGIFASLGSIAIGIPILMLVCRIVRDRPFSSYSSSRGGWNHKLFWKLLLPAFLICGIPCLVQELMGGFEVNNQFSLASLLLLTIMGPLQCIAEEYFFRGYLMQTLGSWMSLPISTILLSSALFASMHPYNIVGVATIFLTGCMMGVMAWITKGLEASSALHVINNMVAFYLQGFGISTISSEVSVAGLIATVIIDGVYIAALLALRRRGWFDEVIKDDVTPWNERIERKQRDKQIKKERKDARSPVLSAQRAEQERSEASEF